MIRLVCILTCLIFVTPCFAAKTLTKISTSQIGDTVVKIPGKNSGLLDKVIDSTGSVLDAVVETTIALNKSGALKAGANAAALTIPLIAKRAIPALGAAYAVGYLADCAFDLAKAHENKWLDDYPLLKAILDQQFPSSSKPTVGTGIDDMNNLRYKIASDWQSYSYRYTWWINQQLSIGNKFNNSNNYFWVVIGKNIAYVDWSDKSNDYDAYKCYSADVVVDPTAPLYSPNTLTLTPAQAHSLGQAIVNAFTSNPAVKDAIDSLAKAHPEVVTTPTPITQQDINNWATTNNYNTNQTYIDYLTNLKNTYEGDSTWIDQEIAKAQAEQEKEQSKDAEDTFDPITSSPFDPAYNPGEFDIPARFTSFLQNVKSSGLFSFSSSFFNSLPGGGSPLLTVNGGQTFGTHTYDFSQAFSSGLPILKSVLLALFGFLSIRAVIMKR